MRKLNFNLNYNKNFKVYHFKFDWASCFGAKKVWSSALVKLNKDAIRNLTYFTSGYISTNHPRSSCSNSYLRKYSSEI
jgi:hypothetical protein